MPADSDTSIGDSCTQLVIQTSINGSCTPLASKTDLFDQNLTQSARIRLDQGWFWTK